MFNLRYITLISRSAWKRYFWKIKIEPLHYYLCSITGGEVELQAEMPATDKYNYTLKTMGDYKRKSNMWLPPASQLLITQSLLQVD